LESFHFHCNSSFLNQTEILGLTTTNIIEKKKQISAIDISLSFQLYLLYISVLTCILEQDGDTSGVEGDNWNTDDELEIDNFSLSSNSSLTLPNGEAVACSGEVKKISAADAKFPLVPALKILAYWAN
jgi:hypothetical protein